MSKLSQKKAFTLVELSVVIVIISLLIAAVLISRILVDSARINKIQEDYRNYNTSIQEFQTAYNCIPGDCAASQLVGPQFASLNPSCIVTSSSGSINSETKRTCMFHEMQLAGIISGLDTAATLTESIAGKNMPFSIFSRGGAWDFTLVTTNAGTPLTFPLEIGNGSGQMPVLQKLIGQHILTLRDARSTTCGSGNACGIIMSGASNYSGLLALPALSPTLAYKLDVKFDDGMPYTGSIYGGIAPFVWQTTTSCVPMSIGSGFDQTTSYMQSNNVLKGCFMIYGISL